MRIRQQAEKEGVEREVAEWLLPAPPDAYAAGATRNLSLLVTAGIKMVTVDDDTLGVGVRHPKVVEGYALVGHYDPRDAIWFSRRQEARAYSEALEAADVVDAHEAALTAAEIGFNEWNLAHACKHLQRLCAGERDGRVVVSLAGVIGDAAVYCPYSALLNEGKTREALVASETQMKLALTSREVCKMARQYAITDDSGVMLYCAGLNNTIPIAPFYPIGFNEDGVFGSIVRFVEPLSLTAHVPVAVRHESSRASAYDFERPP